MPDSQCAPRIINSRQRRQSVYGQQQRKHRETFSLGGMHVAQPVVGQDVQNRRQPAGLPASSVADGQHHECRDGRGLPDGIEDPQCDRCSADEDGRQPMNSDNARCVLVPNVGIQTLAEHHSIGDILVQRLVESDRVENAPAERDHPHDHEYGCDSERTGSDTHHRWCHVAGSKMHAACGRAHIVAFCWVAVSDCRPIISAA